MRRRPIAALAAALFALTSAADASALGKRALTDRLETQMARAGSASGAYVVDLTTGRRLYGLRDRANRIVASNEKLWTSVAALETFGDTGFLRTTVLAGRPVPPSGILRGNLYLRGEGDPSLSTAGLEVLAQQLADAGLAKVTGRVVGDESAFDERRGPTSRGIQDFVGGPLGALVVDRGSSGASEPADFAATVLARQLRDAGVRVSANGKVGRTPRGAVALDFRRSPSITTLIRAMNVPSDNYVAEMLLKAVAAADGIGTTVRGARIAAGILDARYGVTPRITDGSGLSRRDRATPRELVALLGQLVDDVAFYGSLAIMGRTGTLEDRLESDYAAERCRGKTGTLDDVSALSGYCDTRGGDILAYSILMNRVDPTGARQLQDRMVAAIARYE